MQWSGTRTGSGIFGETLSTTKCLGKESRLVKKFSQPCSWVFRDILSSIFSKEVEEVLKRVLATGLLIEFTGSQVVMEEPFEVFSEVASIGESCAAVEDEAVVCFFFEDGVGLSNNEGGEVYLYWGSHALLIYLNIVRVLREKIGSIWIGVRFSILSRMNKEITGC